MALWRVGCVGAGYFSQFHYEAWRRIAGVSVVGAVDHDLPRAEATGAPAFTDLDAMLATARPDIVDIITPPPTHLAAIRTALTYKPRAIICQKPFCQSPDEAETAISLAAAANVPLVIHENFRFQPWYRRIKVAMDAGDIGEPLQFTFRLRPGDGQGPRAYLDRQPYFQTMARFLVHETAVHWIDTFRFLMGAPQRVFADLRQLNPAIAGEDAGYILFAYEDGRRALFDGNRLLDHAAENSRCTMGEALVEGTTGTLTLAGDGAVHLRAFGTEERRELLGPSTTTSFGGDCVYHLQRHVVAALEEEAPLENEAADYRAVLRTEDAVYRAAEAGTWVAL
ncbi:MAG: Gfo/Idh/MocA family oxidoreductase [Pseudomonadota bacterium]